MKTRYFLAIIVAGIVLISVELVVAMNSKISEITPNQLPKQIYLKEKANGTISIPQCKQDYLIVVEGNHILAVCRNTDGANETVSLDLPPPVLVQVPAGPCYGNGPCYLIEMQNPPQNLLNSQQKQVAIKIATSIPEIKESTFDWKLGNFTIFAYQHKRFAEVDLTIPEIKHIGYLTCGWNAAVNIDLETWSIAEKHDTNLSSYEKC